MRQLIFDETIPDRRQAVVTQNQTITWGQLREEAHRIVGAYPQLGKRRVGLSFNPVATSYAALAAFDELACDVFLFDARASLEDTIYLSKKLRLGALVVPAVDGISSPFQVHDLPEEAPWSERHTVTILTSGSTGEPKAVRHTWDSLCRPVRKRPEDSAPRWFLTYQPNLYAGLQVMLQCFADHGTLCLADHGMDPRQTAQLMNDAGVQFVSATPSYWRRLLLFVDRNLLKQIPLIQITLGGEVVDQAILDNLHDLFPNSRLLHIYATTELGRCFSVNDGQAGFPLSYLESRLSDGTELLLREGELLVRSSNSMTMYDPLSSQKMPDSGWFATGDLVEVKGNRVYFVGRRTEMINVAGSKVYPLAIERVIRNVPGVVDVRIYGKVSSIAGELVACELVPEEGRDHNRLKEDVVRACRSQLASYQQPRLIKFVKHIDLSSAGKTLRSKTA